jgi:Arc-like DNA binding domain
MPKKSEYEIVSTRLRLPTGLHRMITASAKRNNRSVNSEILWGLAHYLGEEAPKFVEHMKVEQQRLMRDVLQTLIANPQDVAKMIADVDKELDDVGDVPLRRKKGEE